MSYQKIIIQGNVGQVHETKYTTSNDAVVGFSVAYSEGKDKPTTWFNCTAFKKTAEVVEKYVHKGDAILVEGRIHCEKYKDKSGQDKEAWKVIVDKVALLGGKKSTDSPVAETNQQVAQDSKPQAKAFDNFDDEIPF